MAGKKKYTFDNWEKGKVVLVETLNHYERSIDTKAEEDPNKPIEISLEEIRGNDVPKIRSNQKVLFEKQVQKLFEDWEEDFTKRYISSELKVNLLKSSISDFKTLLMGKRNVQNIGHERQGVFKTNNYTLYFTSFELEQIRLFFKRHIYSGLEYSYDFMHSPGCVYYHSPNLAPQVYAKVFWMCLNWLQNTLKSLEQKTIDLNNLDLTSTSAVQKILYLNELGVLDFLRTKQPFLNSIHSLAVVLSAITGEKSLTIQPNLNVLYGKTVIKKNDPYKSQKSVDEVKAHLEKIGFLTK
jgi:hypothetical protein